MSKARSMRKISVFTSGGKFSVFTLSLLKVKKLLVHPGQGYLRSTRAS